MRSIGSIKLYRTADEEGVNGRTCKESKKQYQPYQNARSKRARCIRQRRHRKLLFGSGNHAKVASLGFFEDIPALLVVILGLGIFLASLLGVAIRQEECQQDLRHQTQVQDLLSSLSSHQLLKDEPDGSVLSLNTLEELSAQSLFSNFSTARLGFKFSMDIWLQHEGNGTGQIHLTYQPGTSPNDPDSMISARTTVVVRVEGYHYPAILQISAWGWVA